MSGKKQYYGKLKEEAEIAKTAKLTNDLNKVYNDLDKMIKTHPEDVQWFIKNYKKCIKQKRLINTIS